MSKNPLTTAERLAQAMRDGYLIIGRGRRDDPILSRYGRLCWNHPRRPVITVTRYVKYAVIRADLDSMHDSHPDIVSRRIRPSIDSFKPMSRYEYEMLARHGIIIAGSFNYWYFVTLINDAEPIASLIYQYITKMPEWAMQSYCEAQVVL